MYISLIKKPEINNKYSLLKKLKIKYIHKRKYGYGLLSLLQLKKKN